MPLPLQGLHLLDAGARVGLVRQSLGSLDQCPLRLDVAVVLRVETTLQIPSERIEARLQRLRGRAIHR